MAPIGAAAFKEVGKATLKALGTTAVGEVAKAASNKVVNIIFNRKSAAESSAEELQKHRKQITEELTGEFQKHQKRLAVLVGIVCIILGSVVGGSVVWYVLQSSRHSERVIFLKELEQYEKARDAGLQALENYVIQNPNSPYIDQAKALIRTYKGTE